MFTSTGFTALSTSAFTLPGTTALDDFNEEHLVAGYYVVGTNAALETVSDFLDAVAAESGGTPIYESGSYDLGTGASKSFTATQTAGKYITVLAISDDGSCSLISKVIPS